VAEKPYIPQTLDDLTPEWLTAALQERGVLREARVQNIRRQILGDGAGFMGIIARLELELDRAEEGAPASLIAKLPTPVEQNRTMGELLGAYEREILFYDELAPNVPVRVPQTYYSAFDRDRGSEKQEQIIGTVDKMPIWLIRRSMPLARWIARRKKRRYVLLMEDLGRARMGDQVKGGAPADCERALVAMAAAHAALWESPQLEGRFYLTRQDLQTRTRHSMFRDARDDFTKRFAALLPRGLDRLVEWLDANGAEVARRLHSDAPQTLIHGDFRLDNIFFEDDAADPVIIIDWQLVGRGCAAYDVAYLLGGALRADAPREVELALLRGYHDALVGHGVKDYDYDRYVRDYERGLMTVIQTMATTSEVEMGEERGLTLIDLWVERLFARARHIDLDALL
jgi:hypothetical protein